MSAAPFKPTLSSGTMQQLEFSVVGDYVELNQLLKLIGICDSGGAGKALVASGAVSVDGKPELRKTCKIRAGQTVTLGDVRINVTGAPPSGS
jgi:ribosome-associated protein